MTVGDVSSGAPIG